MKKKLFFALVLSTAFFATANAQTNLQIFYDFGKDRQQITTTLEGFYNDKWGNTFFFIDHDFALKKNLGNTEYPAGTYMEVARCLNFWQNSALAPLSLHVEYNGGVYKEYGIKHAFLAGVDWFLHSQDFRNTLNLKLLYKGILNTDQKVPMQFTVVWGMQDLFGAKGLRFSGFADFWWEDHTICPWLDSSAAGYRDWSKAATSHVVFISEPQLWYNFGTEHFNLGGEIELSYDFGTLQGFRARPCLGMKWVF